MLYCTEPWTITRSGENTQMARCSKCHRCGCKIVHNKFWVPGPVSRWCFGLYLFAYSMPDQNTESALGHEPFHMTEISSFSKIDTSPNSRRLRRKYPELECEKSIITNLLSTSKRSGTTWNHPRRRHHDAISLQNDLNLTFLAYFDHLASYGTN